MYGLVSFSIDYKLRTGDQELPFSPVTQRIFAGSLTGGLFLARPLAMAGLPLAVPGGFAMGALAGLCDGVIRWLSMEARAGIVQGMEGVRREKELSMEDQVRAVGEDGAKAVRMAELAEYLAKKSRDEEKKR